MMNRFDIASQPATNMKRVSRAIGVAADRNGVDFDYLKNQARVESGFRADAKASTSSAPGLFQFTRQTWLATLKQHGSEHNYGWAADAIQVDKHSKYSVSDAQLRVQILELRIQPEPASVIAAEFLPDNRDVLASALGWEPEAVDLYLAHFLGSGGATNFRKAWEANPSQPAPIQFRSIEPMPQKLSIEFARSAYGRLAELNAGRV